MLTLESHLDVDEDWLTESAPVAEWRFGPGPSLTNFPSWIAAFESFDGRVFVRAIHAASSACIPQRRLDPVADEHFVAAMENLHGIRQWIDGNADDHPAWLRIHADPSFNIHWHDGEYRDHWFTKPYSASMWALDSAQHCLMTMHAITREHGRNTKTYGTTCAVCAANALRCDDVNWKPAIARLVNAMRAEFGA